MIANKDLIKIFNHLNKKYFDEQLHADVKFGIIEDDGETIVYKNLQQVIVIHSDFKYHPDIAAFVLLHEMIHANLNRTNYKGGHGMRFQAEKVRLIMEGAYDELL
jgi:hypothetical protein